MMQGISRVNSYYYFDGIRSLALIKGHEDIKNFTKQLNQGEFIDKYELMEDSVEISFENRPHLTG
jgi:hypothetical protein